MRGACCLLGLQVKDEPSIVTLDNEVALLKAGLSSNSSSSSCRARDYVSIAVAWLRGVASCPEAVLAWQMPLAAGTAHHRMPTLCNAAVLACASVII